MSKELTIDSNLWKKPNKIVKLSNLEFDKIKIVDAEKFGKVLLKVFKLRIS